MSIVPYSETEHAGWRVSGDADVDNSLIASVAGGPWVGGPCVAGEGSGAGQVVKFTTANRVKVPMS